MSTSPDEVPLELGRSAAGAGLLGVVADELPTGILLTTPDGTIVLVNRELERQFGYTRDELIGQPVDMLLTEPFRAPHAALRERLLADPEMRPMGAGHEVFGLRGDGSQCPVEVVLSPIETAHGVFVLVSVVDVTARRQIEDANRQTLESQLEFERLVAELSVQFINLPADEVDDVIQRALGRIAEALDIDRCAFYHIREDGIANDPVRWARDGIPHAPGPVDATLQFPWVLDTLRSGSVVCFSTLDEVPSPIDRASYMAAGTRSAVIVPLFVTNRIVGGVGFNAVRQERRWHPETVHRLKMIGATLANVMARRRSDEALRVALADVKRLSDQLLAENLYLRREVQAQHGGTIVGQSPAIRRVLELVQQVAATDSTVLLLGETGTGKELFATQIHSLSTRRGRPMVRVNCSAIPTALMESELFGREKGAYTGALTRQIGRFELADQSTIFLDEIGELSLEVQVKLLRVLEERQIERLGSPKSIAVNTRIIAATHRDLDRRIAEGTFREDLFYRLNVFPIQVPPLRDRVDDIPLLVWRFVDEFAKTFGKPIEAIPRENMAALQQYSWPGNIRELRNVVERAMIVATGPRLIIGPPVLAAAAVKRSARLADVEKAHIRSVLESVGWRIRGAGGAADRLGLKPTTLETRMAKLGLSRPKPGRD